jgi:ankyrin repeat protein
MNRLEPQFRQPSLYFAALITADEIASEMIKLLIRYGANVFFKDHNEQTILFYICRDGKN